MASKDTAPKEKKIEPISIFETNEVPSDELLEPQSPPYISYDTKIFGRTIDYVEDAATSNANIGTISVQNSTDVALGHKTYFNGPVMMKQMMVDDAQRKADKSASLKQEKAKETHTCKMLSSLHKHRFLACSILTIFAVIITATVVVVYFFDIFDNNGGNAVNPTTCEEIPSTPSYYNCGYASACTRCRAMFPQKEICQSYYEPDCGSLRCFCKPQCRSVDCATTSNNLFFNML